MKRFYRFYYSIVGRKIIAALTGLFLLVFLLVHALGNLNSFAGINADGIPAINAYADYLRNLATPLVPKSLLVWLFRLLLLIAFVLHVIAVLSLMHINRAARTVDYQKRQYRHISFAAHWVFFSGLLLLLFIITHVSHFTLGILTPFESSPDDIYHNLNSAFQNGWLVLFYILSLAALGLHLGHGIWSMFQTLGLDNPDRNLVLRLIAAVTSIGLVTVFVSIPLAFYFDFLMPIN
ncbi:MAG: hypothetical protein EP297_11760 [Gammaproteobacteria bacterium]|nr:MAG: hypothetical protein EP297_11760 [Gammaproteobacteria bacterium]